MQAQQAKYPTPGHVSWEFSFLLSLEHLTIRHSLAKAITHAEVGISLSITANTI
jgi:hypothetical protein